MTPNIGMTPLPAALHAAVVGAGEAHMKLKRKAMGRAAAGVEL